MYSTPVDLSFSYLHSAVEASLDTKKDQVDSNSAKFLPSAKDFECAKFLPSSIDFEGANVFGYANVFVYILQRLYFCIFFCILI
jgi:hypothetical protein